MSWQVFEQESPELAAAVRARFEAHPHHVIATLRAAGAPRASGTNVMFVGAELLIGCMPGAVKGADLRRDGRYSLHSATLDEQLVGGDAKVAGTATLLDDDERVAVGAVPGHGTGTGTEPPDGDYFRLGVDEASLVEVDGDQLVVTSWSRSAGTRRRTRR